MTYRERRERKAERLRDWAAKREARAAASFAKAASISDMIPFGQPILVGHHSEGRHRRDIGRIDGAVRAGVESSRMAGDFSRRADSIEAQADHAIYSDDPDAIEALTERIILLEAERDRIKAFNASCWRGTPDENLLDEEQRADLQTIKRLTAYNLGKKGEMPAYKPSNLNGNIGRNRKRLEQLRLREGVETGPATTR